MVLKIRLIMGVVSFIDIFRQYVPIMAYWRALSHTNRETQSRKVFHSISVHNFWYSIQQHLLAVSYNRVFKWKKGLHLWLYSLLTLINILGNFVPIHKT